MTEKTTTLDIAHTIRTIGSSPDYAEARSRYERHPIPEEQKKPAAIRMAALALRGKEEGAHFSLQEHALNLTAQLTTFKHELESVHRLRQQGARRKEILPHLAKMTEFNHALKDMIDSNPRLKFAEVVSFLRNMNQQIHGRHNDREFDHEIRGILEGMRHEIAFEQMSIHMDGVEIDHVSVEEDLNGGDYYVSIDGSDWTPVDVKASYLTAERAREEARSRGYDATHIVWSQVNDEDFDGGFRISYETAKHKAPALEREIRQAVNAHAVAV